MNRLPGASHLSSFVENRGDSHSVSSVPFCSNRQGPIKPISARDEYASLPLSPGASAFRGGRGNAADAATDSPGTWNIRKMIGPTNPPNSAGVLGGKRLSDEAAAAPVWWHVDESCSSMAIGGSFGSNEGHMISKYKTLSADEIDCEQTKVGNEPSPIIAPSLLGKLSAAAAKRVSVRPFCNDKEDETRDKLCVAQDAILELRKNTVIIMNDRSQFLRLQKDMRASGLVTELGLQQKMHTIVETRTADRRRALGCSPSFPLKVGELGRDSSTIHHEFQNGRFNYLVESSIMYLEQQRKVPQRLGEGGALTA
eukprot:CAMPEP_0197440170 /NCGR_PEP_ID=MMETSP1175-20131217/6739_1 /TAXON_ID=1003142 /ORGANISM="Triceratium dubium, Strain CCMP147" /LENGTH=310 /DNA_ID=CAMNT_0042970231 /DNA_START=63 /DNA_END=998 /DNA_ORIENTATION=+